MKRWLALLTFGVALLGLGVVYLIVILFRQGLSSSDIYRAITLQFLSPWGRVAVATIVGAIATLYAIRQLSRVALHPFIQTGGVSLADAVYQQRLRERGPRIVAIGGGKGLSVLLRGLKSHTNNITAIITVADDGGSSGRLRRELGLPPPGDFRNCIAALSNDETLTTQLLQYRFGLASGKGELSGHSFGNLFIAAMAGITGSFEKGVEQSSKVLAIVGKILPSTLANVTLVADVREQSALAPGTQIPPIRRVEGESDIPKVGRTIERVFLTPERAPAYPSAVKAIIHADLVILGPGSLFTSILPNLLIQGIHQALNNTHAKIIFVCNVANQPGETDGFTTEDHVLAMERHIGKGVIDTVLVNDEWPPSVKHSDIQFVNVVHRPGHVKMLSRDLIDERFPWRHNSKKLAKTVLSMI